MKASCQHSFRMKSLEAEAKFRAFVEWSKARAELGSFHGPTAMQEIVVAALDEYMAAHPGGWQREVRRELTKLRKEAA